MDTVKYCIIYNPLSDNGKGKEHLDALVTKLGADAVGDIFDMTSIESYSSFFDEHKTENILICGGDGTLNRFINDTASLELENSFFYYAAGTGNDFLRDIGADTNEVINIDRYIKNLPICTVNGKDYRFINGIGFGIDGYCCEIGDKLRATSDKPINYTGIAIKGLLFHFKAPSATVTVDGVSHTFKKVWIAPTMKGRYYGGGMIPTPNQDRFDESGDVSLMLFHTTGRIRTLMIFPKIFKGEHIKHTNAITIFKGKEITVEFDSPRALQVDGETVLDVKSYTVRTTAPAKLQQEKELVNA